MPPNTLTTVSDVAAGSSATRPPKDPALLGIPPSQLSTAPVHILDENHPLTDVQKAKAQQRLRQLRDNKRTYTFDEVSQHDKIDDCWIVFKDKVYDITLWIERHPGGVPVILGVAGRDATEPFASYHPLPAYKHLACYHIGELDAYKQTPLTKEFHEISQKMIDLGWHEPQTSVYLTKTAILAAALGFVIWGVQHATSTWQFTGLAVILGLFWHQLSFFGHDLGHSAVSQVPTIDARLGHLVTLCYGVSVQWWRRTHYQHHTYTNSCDYDPDIQHLPVFAVTDKFFTGFWSHYHRKLFHFDSIARFIVGYQHILYVPVMLVARLNLYLQSWLLVLNPRSKVPARKLEIMLLLGFFAWVSYLVSFIPTWPQRFLFLFVAHAVTGMVHVQITLSHFAMDFYWGDGYKEPDHWVEMQLATSLDVDCSLWMDWFHGGLQYQVVHHLFPRLQRHRLRQARKEFLEPLCKKYGLKYHHMPFFPALWFVINSMRQQAYQAQKMPTASLGTSKLFQLLMAAG